MPCRLFTAIALPEVVQTPLANLSVHLPGINWIPQLELHLRLRSLGDIDEGKIGLVEERLGRVTVEPFFLPVEGLGVSPTKGSPRTVWAGLGKGHPRLHQLRQRCDDVLLNAGIHFNVRTFHPHIALGRCFEPDRELLAEWLADNRNYDAPPFKAVAFDLCRSDDGTTDKYAVLRRFNLS